MNLLHHVLLLLLAATELFVIAAAWLEGLHVL